MPPVLLLLAYCEDLCADSVFREFIKEIAGNFGEPHETPVIGRHELDATAQITTEGTACDGKSSRARY